MNTTTMRSFVRHWDSRASITIVAIKEGSKWKPLCQCSIEIAVDGASADLQLCRGDGAKRLPTVLFH